MKLNSHKPGKTKMVTVSELEWYRTYQPKIENYRLRNILAIWRVFAIVGWVLFVGVVMVETNRIWEWM